MAENKKSMTKAELEALVANLYKEIEQLKEEKQNEEVEAPMEEVSSSEEGTVAQAQVQYINPNEVTIVYCSDSLGSASISNLKMNFHRFGEEFTLSRQQFDELVGRYYNWFEKGILAVSFKNVDVAAAKGVKTDKEYALNKKVLAQLGKMNVKQLEELWNSVEVFSHKQSIVSYFKRKFIEGDKDFTQRDKIDLLNRLTDGAFSREQDELNGRIKIMPTEM